MSKTIDQAIGLPAAVLAAIASTLVFKDNTSLARFLAIAVTALIALITFLNLISEQISTTLPAINIMCWPGKWKTAYKVERYYRGAQILPICDGTGEIQKNIIGSSLFPNLG